ncbi:HAMP domain-containing protein [candidate division KSB1 bacterium]|nr:HAMP domain-containing protein [candidate division KSB1 bacterium]
MKIRITQTLSFRLFSLVSAVMTVGFCFYTYHTVTTHTNQVLERVYESADSASDIIKRSTRYGMLLNRKDDVHHIINTIAQEKNVEGIRIYNKKGDIIFSTIPSEQNTSVDMKAEACNICHSEEQPLESLPTKNRRRIYRTVDGKRVLGVINPIDNEFECYNAACHAHSGEQTILGVLDVKMSLDSVDKQLRHSRNSLIINAVFIVLGVAVLSGLFIYFVVRKRVKKLIVGTKEIARGHLKHKIEIQSKDEIGQLAYAFNYMTSELDKARAEITNWSSSLEEKVVQKTRQLEKTQEQMIRIEKLASLGKLSSTVAHEINNPLAGCLNFTMLTLRIMDNHELTTERKASVIKYLNIIKSEITRCGDIVKNMLVFAKQSGGEFTMEHLHNLITSSVMLVSHKMSLKEIKVQKNLACKDDMILCDSGQIRQALIALFVNAIEAMGKGGMLTVETKSSEKDDSIILIIMDTGSGMSEDIISQIFDPFFTTKKEGKGVGLGLSVVYGILERHKGKISVTSRKNEGTTFTIELLRKPDINVTQIEENNVLN